MFKACASRESEKMTIRIVEEFFPDVMEDEGKKYRPLLTSLEIPESSIDTLLLYSRQLVVGKTLLTIIRNSQTELDKLTSLERLAKLQPFEGAEATSLPIIKDFISLKEAYFSMEKTPATIADVSYNFFFVNDKKKLRDMELFQKIDVQRLEAFSKIFDLIDFLQKDMKEKKLVEKLKKQLDDTKWKWRDKLIESYKRFDFLLNPVMKSQELVEFCLKECSNDPSIEMKEFHSLIDFMSASKNLSEFKHEQHKAIGNFNDIIADLIKNCIFLIELDSEKHVFQLTAKVLESQTGSGNYNEEDLKDYFTKARILINEAKKSAADDEKLKDFGVNDLVSISMALESIQRSLVDLFETGLINRNFQSPLIENLIKDGNRDFVIIDKNTKLGFHVKTGEFRRLEKIAKKLSAKAIQSAESYRSLIMHSENHLLTYFTQEKMDALIRCLSSDLEAWSKPENKGIIGILMEGLNIDEETLKRSLKDAKFKEKNIVEQVYKFRSDAEDKQGSTFVMVAACLNELKREVTIIPESRDIFGSGRKVSYININDGSNINQLEFLLTLLYQSKEQGKKRSYISQILYGTETVSQIDLLAFLNRCFRDNLKRDYAILNPAGLSEPLQKCLTEFIETTKEIDIPNKRLFIFNNLHANELFKNQDFFYHIEEDSIIKSGFLDKSQFVKSYLDRLQSLR
jgi:hypothetical protein